MQNKEVLALALVSQLLFCLFFSWTGAGYTNHKDFAGQQCLFKSEDGENSVRIVGADVDPKDGEINIFAKFDATV